MATRIENQSLGFSFIMMGLGLIVPMGLMLGWTFAWIGLPLVMAGIAFLASKGEDEA